MRIVGQYRGDRLDRIVVVLLLQEVELLGESGDQEGHTTTCKCQMPNAQWKEGSQDSATTDREYFSIVSYLLYILLQWGARCDAGRPGGEERQSLGQDRTLKAAQQQR